MDSNRAKISIMFADGIINHRTACKTYAGTHKSFREKLEKISTTYIILKKHPAKKKRETFSNNLKQFTEECESLFDIRTSYKQTENTRETLECPKAATGGAL